MVVPNFSLLVVFVGADNLILFAGDPFLEIVNIVRIMEKVEFVLGCFLGLEHGEVITQIVILDEGVGHFDSEGFHGVFLAEVVIGDRVVVEVAHLTHLIF